MLPEHALAAVITSHSKSILIFENESRDYIHRDGKAEYAPKRPENSCGTIQSVRFKHTYNQITSLCHPGDNDVEKHQETNFYKRIIKDSSKQYWKYLYGF